MDLFRKRQQSAQNAQQGAPDKMQAAVQHRKEQGRGPLDEWDMFANVMATRAALPDNHPSHLSLEQVTEMTAQEVHRATNLPLPNAFAVEDSSGHAATSGGWAKRKGVMTQKPTQFTMKKNYLESALGDINRAENTDRFRKLVRTTAHELTHVGQRAMSAIMEHSTSQQREMEAYSSEILQHPALPALQGDQLRKTVSKFDKQAQALGRPLSPMEQGLSDQVHKQAQTGKGVGN